MGNEQTSVRILGDCAVWAAIVPEAPPGGQSGFPATIADCSPVERVYPGGYSRGGTSLCLGKVVDLRNIVLPRG